MYVGTHSLTQNVRIDDAQICVQRRTGVLLTRLSRQVLPPFIYLSKHLDHLLEPWKFWAWRLLSSSLFLSISLSLYLSLSLNLSLSLFLHLSQYLFLCLLLYFSLSFSLSISLCLSISFSLFCSLSVSLYVWVYLSFSQSLYISSIHTLSFPHLHYLECFIYIYLLISHSPTRQVSMKEYIDVGTYLPTYVWMFHIFNRTDNHNASIFRPVALSISIYCVFVNDYVFLFLLLRAHYCKQM